MVSGGAGPDKMTPVRQRLTPKSTDDGSLLRGRHYRTSW